MLNISSNTKVSLQRLQQYRTVRQLDSRRHYKILNRIIWATSLLGLVILFLPWTQNISGTGAVTALKPDQRPQTVHTAIAGRIEKWYVKEGDHVKKGDTILFLSEIKDGYFDPELLTNTQRQMEAKRSALQSYDRKVASLESQVLALENERALKRSQALNKIRQARLKTQSDSIEFEAVKTQLKIASTQFERAVQLNKEGLKPLTDLEEKRLKLQEAQAKIITQENKWLTSKNELINARVEINRIAAEYDEKIAKSGSDKYTALSSQFDTQAQVSKLESQYANYAVRNGMYYVTAPQSGYVNRALQSGIGETVKEGTPLVSIMPAHYEIAVETYVRPIDLPLLKRGDKVRVWFDGWPTVVFSGWPGISYGTFGGRIVAIENLISQNGKYRVLVAPDPTEAAWPEQLSIGAGARTIALLDTVPVWFEVWRVLNGFPPNYYQSDAKTKSGDKK